MSWYKRIRYIRECVKQAPNQYPSLINIITSLWHTLYIEYRKLKETVCMMIDIILLIIMRYKIENITSVMLSFFFLTHNYPYIILAAYAVSSYLSSLLNIKTNKGNLMLYVVWTYLPLIFYIIVYWIKDVISVFYFYIKCIFKNLFLYSHLPSTNNTK